MLQNNLGKRFSLSVVVNFFLSIVIEKKINATSHILWKQIFINIKYVSGLNPDK